MLRINLMNSSENGIRDSRSAVKMRIHHGEEFFNSKRRLTWDLAHRTIRFRFFSSTSSFLSVPRPLPTGSDRKTRTPRKEKEVSEVFRKGRTFEPFPFDSSLTDD
uniref:Uncharacterized protein n=1 Tax=Leptospirillum ferrodiazotrophum TaxID=412449 RepID=C6I102_9BACT|nr:MAG: hypothetical protein UBAL3_96120020 [Leptospirillum ferrodiazotrophum]